jgi:hypothetical protein
MRMDKQQRVELRAYAIWQEEGQPQGRHEVHWLLAEREIAAETAAKPKRRSATVKTGATVSAGA